MRVWQTQANLNKGELDPTLRGRIDTELYYSGLTQARNVLLKPQGGAKKRPGTKHLYTFPTGFAPDLIRNFSFNVDTSYVLCFYIVKSPGTSRIYIFKDGVLQTNINGSGNDYLAAPLITTRNLYYIQSANTALIFDGNNPKVLTRTSDTAWTLSNIGFSNVPQYDYNDASSPTPTSEVQQLTFTNANESDTFKLSIDSFLSEEVAYTADTTEMSNRLELAIQAMPNTGTDGISVAHNSGTIYDITFGGNSADPYGLTQALGVITQSTSFQGASTRTTPGVSQKEDAFSATRGWPTCGTFHQGRLYMGGVSSLPDAIFGSVVGDFYNFDEGKARDDESIFVTLQTDQVNSITAMISSRKLQVFTEGGEFFCPEDVITPTRIRFDVATNYGTDSVKPITLDGAVIFPQKTSKALIISNIDNQYQPIQSRNLAVTASHLITEVRDLDVSRGSAETDANYIYLLNTNGDIVCLNYLLAEGVEGFSLWETNGTVQGIAVSNNKLYTLVDRGSDTYLEVEDDDYPVDCGIPITSASVIDTSHYTGTVEVVGDDAYLGEFTSSATVNLPRTVTSGYAGVAFRPTIETMPLAMGLQDGSNYARKKRVRRAIIQYYLSNGIVVNGTRIPDKTLGVNQFSAPIPATALKRVPLFGFDIEKTITVTQTTPMPFHILSIGAEVTV